MNRLKKYWLAFILVLGLVLVIPAGTRFWNVCENENTIGILVNTPQAYNGYTLFTTNKLTYLIDNCGNGINKWTSNYEPGHAVYLLEDGSILRACKVPNEKFDNGGLGGRIERKDWNDNLIWEYTYSDSLASHHHDIYPMPNGNILLLALTRKFREEVISAGRKEENLPDNELYNEQILEIKPTGSNGADVVWEWNVWDHLVQDINSTLPNYGSVSQNPGLFNINYLGLSSGKANWIHFNSIVYNEELDAILLASRQLNEIYIIDHSTSTAQAASHSGGLRNKGGDILYRWGNPAAYEMGSQWDQQLFGPHAPYWIPEDYPDGGKIMIFNNGTGRDSLYSSIEIIDPPGSGFGDYYLSVDKGIYGPEQPSYTYYDRNNPKDFFSLILSNAQRLPNGNTLVNEGTNGRFFEIDPQGNIVWEYINPDTPKGILSQGADAPTGNNVFRIARYPPEYSAFKGKDLKPGAPIEKNPGENCCSIYDGWMDWF